MTDGIYLYVALVGILFLGFLLRVLYKKTYLFMSLRRVDRMEGTEFERYSLFLFEKSGYRGHMTKASGDFGADLILYDEVEKIAVQAKRYDKPVGVAAVQQAMAGMQFYECDRAMVITNMTYTRQAKQLAARSQVTLLDREDLAEMMQQVKPWEWNRNKQLNLEEGEAIERELLEITFRAKVGHEKAEYLSESMVYTILEEALADHGYYVDGE